MKKICIILMVIIIGMVAFSGCQKEINQLAKPMVGDTIAEIVVRDYGSIYFKLFDTAAPKAVENFVTLSKEGFYNGQTFYRIIKDSILETGDSSAMQDEGKSIWGEAFKDEFNPYLQPYHGALCMSNVGPDTNKSQFFIVSASQTYNKEVLKQIELNYDIKFNKKAKELFGKIGGAPWFYKLNTVFGQVYDGFEVIDKISEVEKTDEERGIPATEVIIDEIKISKYK
jgi:peptidyl-prolyl cis-trans isomerase B (cyclophilin B)